MTYLIFNYQVADRIVAVNNQDLTNVSNERLVCQNKSI